jgi:recombinational DNA repair ATPase RecF
MLLDDIFSELDESRAGSLLEMVQSFGQVVLTTARDPDIDFGAQGFNRVEL